ncbi:MAG TPA: protein translocase subunit SecF [Patescibacteria group bacterium]|nr:protein translocase subunit SecF [Patescibacteria group bacterium]
MNIIQKRNWYFALSLLVIVPGLITLFLWGLNLSIDFVPGSKITFSSNGRIEQKQMTEIKNIFSLEKVKVYNIQPSEKSVSFSTQVIDQKKNEAIVNRANNLNVREEEFATVGPTIGKETTINALKALTLASILIVIYITWSFRSVPKPASSLRFGICAIIALVHDVLVVVGSFSILGHFFGVQIDSLFVTALLTIIGFSVHDTIVVFDRIRENLLRMGAGNFENVVNESINQTLVRSLNTSLTVIMVLVALLLFGGESIRWFVVALLIGVTSGTYSSIFNASPLLVVWQNLRSKR